MFQNASKLDHIHLVHDCNSSFTGTSALWDIFKALPCFCLIVHSLKNNLKLEHARILVNAKHTIYIKLLTAYLANTAVSMFNTYTLQTIFRKQNAMHLCAIVQTFCYQCAQICFELHCTKMSVRID